jgi:hypothetical protein
MLRSPSPLWTADPSKAGPSSLTSRRSVPFPAVRHAAMRALGPAQRGHPPAVCEHGREDAVGDVAQLLDRFVEILPELAEGPLV